MENRTLIAFTVGRGEERAPYYDLDRLADEVHREYFSRSIKARVLWGKKIGRKQRRSIRLGSYDPQNQTIRIHPLLDSPDVPVFFIQSILYHEYLHHVLGPHHNRRFHAQERKFRFFRESREWLRRNLHRLLGRKGTRRVPVEPPREQLVQLALFS